MKLTRKLDCFCDIHFKIITDNIISKHVRFQRLHIKFKIIVLMMFIYLLQLKVYFQSLHNVFELIIPNSLTFISEISQRCFLETSIPESAGG